MKKLVDILYEILIMIKTTVKGVQISGDRAIARVIKRAVLDGNINKIKRIMDREGVLVDGDDIVGLWVHKPNEPIGIIITEGMLINYIWMKKIIKRYKRREK